MGDEKKLAMRLLDFVAGDLKLWREAFSFRASIEGEGEVATKGLIVRIGMARGKACSCTIRY